MDINDGFIIFDFKPAIPMTATTPEPETKAPPPRKLTPDQISRTLRSAATPFYAEPVYDDLGCTGRWRVGRELGATERILAEYSDESEARDCLRRLVREFRM